jgi:hypothetical protein
MSSRESTAALLKACGVSGALELEVEDKQQGTRRLTFHQPFLVLGRGGGTDVPLDHPDVSHRHAYLQVLAGRVFCYDLLSRTGLRWGPTLAPAGWLDRDQPLTIGPFRIRIVGGVHEAPSGLGDRDPLAPCPPEEDNLPLVSLESPHMVGNPEPWRVNRVLSLVGKSSRCKVRVHAEGVSRFSCSLLRTPEGLWVIDLLGQPPTRVNDAPVRCALLRDGDYLRVGNVTLRVKYQARTESSPLAAESPATAASPPNEAPGGALVPHPGGLPLSVPERAVIPGISPESATWPRPLVLPGTALAGLPAESGKIDPMVALAGQFSLMQQQMFEQFAQTLLMMGQMFNHLHRDQLALIREELTRLQQVSQDLRAVQTELAQRESGALAGPAPAAETAAPKAVAPPRPESAAPEAGPLPGPDGSAPKAVPRPAPARKGAAADKSAPDIHAELFQRIQQLQQERESRWQKILNYLTGKQPGETAGKG